MCTQQPGKIEILNRMLSVGDKEVQYSVGSCEASYKHSKKLHTEHPSKM